MLNVGRIVTSRNFSDPKGFTVYRKTGSWVGGRWVEAETSIQQYGTITPCNPKDLVQVPEGDRVTGVMCFHCDQEIFTTHVEGDASKTGTSDEILWQGDRYRISSIIPWNDFGYWKAFGVRMVSD